MYQAGDYVVKAGNGVCSIEEIMHPDFVQDKEKLYYELIPLADPYARLYVPVDRADGLTRRVLTETQADELIKNINGIHETWIGNEKEREKSYKTAVQSNDPIKLVGIIKLIYQRGKARQEQGKKVTAVDEKYFKIAENLLFSELEFVMKKDRTEIEALIQGNHF